MGTGSESPGTNELDVEGPGRREVPAPVRELIEVAMVKDPQLRFPDGAAFRDAIDDVRAGRPFRRPEVGTAVLAVPDAPTEPVATDPADSRSRWWITTRPWESISAVWPK